MFCKIFYGPAVGCDAVHAGGCRSMGLECRDRGSDMGFGFGWSLVRLVSGSDGLGVGWSGWFGFGLVLHGLHDCCTSERTGSIRLVMGCGVTGWLD